LEPCDVVKDFTTQAYHVQDGQVNSQIWLTERCLVWTWLHGELCFIHCHTTLICGVCSSLSNT